MVIFIGFQSIHWMMNTDLVTGNVDELQSGAPVYDS